MLCIPIRQNCTRVRFYLIWSSVNPTSYPGCLVTAIFIHSRDETPKKLPSQFSIPALSFQAKISSLIVAFGHRPLKVRRTLAQTCVTFLLPLKNLLLRKLHADFENNIEKKKSPGLYECSSYEILFWFRGILTHNYSKLRFKMTKSTMVSHKVSRKVKYIFQIYILNPLPPENPITWTPWDSSTSLLKYRRNSTPPVFLPITFPLFPDLVRCTWFGGIC